MQGTRLGWVYCGHAVIEPDCRSACMARPAARPPVPAACAMRVSVAADGGMSAEQVVRKVLILLALAVVGAAAWPIYVGVQVENALTQPFTGDVGDLHIRHEVTGYDRQRYRASATSLLRVSGNGLDFEVTLNHRIDHRMLGAAVQTRSGGGPPRGEIPPLLAKALMQARPRADSWLGLGGGVSSRLWSQPVRIFADETEDGSVVPFHLELGAGQGGLAYSPERLVLSFDTSRVDVGADDRRLSLQQMYFGLLVHPGPDGRYWPLPDYDIGLGSGSLSLTRGDRELLGLESLQMSSNQNSTDRRLDSLWRLRAEALRSSGLELETLDLYLSAMRWDRTTLLRLAKDLEGVRAMALGTDLRAGLLLGMVMEGLKQMVEQDPLLQGQLRLNSEPGKHVRVALDLGLRGDADSFAARPLESVALDLDLEVGLALIEELAALVAIEAGIEPAEAEVFQGWLDLAVAEQWIRIDNGILRSVLRMEDGRLRINDRDQTVLLLALVFGLARGMF